MEQGLEEYERVQKQNLNTLTDAARDKPSWPYASIYSTYPAIAKNVVKPNGSSITSEGVLAP